MGTQMLQMMTMMMMMMIMKMWKVLLESVGWGRKRKRKRKRALMVLRRASSAASSWLLQGSWVVPFPVLHLVSLVASWIPRMVCMGRLLES